MIGSYDFQLGSITETEKLPLALCQVKTHYKGKFLYIVTCTVSI